MAGACLPSEWLIAMQSGPERYSVLILLSPGIVGLLERWRVLHHALTSKPKRLIIPYTSWDFVENFVRSWV